MSVWLTPLTRPTGMPRGKTDVSGPDFQPAVTSRSPSLTTSDLGTLSTISELPGSLWRRIPQAPVFASRTDTALVSSVISFTFAVLEPTVVVTPTRNPFDDTTGSLGRT